MLVLLLACNVCIKQNCDTCLVVLKLLTCSRLGSRFATTGTCPPGFRPRWPSCTTNSIASLPTHTALLPADAAKAFRELRVRPGRAASPLRAGGGGEQREQRERGGGLPERPPSPKKRKASYNIDKEFILKDDKVKRNTGAAGGGMVGGLAATMSGALLGPADAVFVPMRVCAFASLLLPPQQAAGLSRDGREPLMWRVHCHPASFSSCPD